MANLAEELLLLAYHDETGRNQIMHLEIGLAGAVLMDLAIAERIDVVDKRVVVVDRAPVGDPLLDDALQRIFDDKPRRARSWVSKLAKGLTARVRERMAAAGALVHERDSVLIVFPFHRYRAAPGNSIEGEALSRLQRVVEHGRAKDASSAALACLVYALSMEKKVFPDRKRRDVRALLKGVSRQPLADDATHQAVAASLAAFAAAIATNVAATNAAASGGGG